MARIYFGICKAYARYRSRLADLPPVEKILNYRRTSRLAVFFQYKFQSPYICPIMSYAISQEYNLMEWA